MLSKLDSLGYIFVADSLDISSINLCRSRSFKVTICCTNWKPIYDFLLVNNTSLHPILHSFHVIADIGLGLLVKFFAFDNAYLSLTLSFGVKLWTEDHEILL